MLAFIYYPFYLITFWYKDVLGNLLSFFVDFNRYIASLLSFPLLVKTFFKPLKNEYRDGLVIFSIVFGICIKSVLVLVGLFTILVMLFVEVLVLFFLSVIPIVLLVMLVSPQTIIR